MLNEPRWKNSSWLDLFYSKGIFAKTIEERRTKNEERSTINPFRLFFFIFLVRQSASIFHHLHLHTDSSILDGFGTCDEYADIAVANGMRYLCVTDHGMMAAVPHLIESCAARGLEPVIGIEAYLNDYQHLVPRWKELDSDTQQAVRKSYHLLLIAMNQSGYQKLVRLSSEAWERGFYYRPRMNWKSIAELCSTGDVICTSGCFASEISEAVYAKTPAEAEDMVKKYLEVFAGRFYLEWMMIRFQGQEENNLKIIRLADKLGLPTVVTNDVHFAVESDSICQQAQLLINSKTGTFSDPAGLQYDSTDLWFCTERDLDARWRERYATAIPLSVYEESKKRTLEVCERSASPDIDTSLKLPVLPNAEAEFVEIVWKNLKKRGLSEDPEYRARLEEEIATIVEKGFCSYFLIVKMLVDRAKEVGACVGPGRGSAVGSLACYLLGITDVDPVKHGLLFWRFLSPTRGGKLMKLEV